MSEETQDTFYVTDDQAFSAIFENKPITVKFRIGVGERERELELAIMWPDADDESEILARSAEYLGVRPEFATPNDIAWARGRAAIEQLACDPYPEWLAGPNGEGLGKQKVTWRGKQRLQPNTGALKSRAIPASFYYAYSEVINRFHSLVAG